MEPTRCASISAGCMAVIALPLAMLWSPILPVSMLTTFTITTTTKIRTSTITTTRETSLGLRLPTFMDRVSSRPPLQRPPLRCPGDSGSLVSFTGSWGRAALVLALQTRSVAAMCTIRRWRATTSITIRTQTIQTMSWSRYSKMRGI